MALMKLVLLASLPLLSQGLPTGGGGCAIHSARAVDDALDSAVYILASIARCETIDEDHGIRCALDVSSAIEAVNAMVNVIVQALEDCDVIHAVNDECGLAVGSLTEGMAGVSAAAAGIVARCPNKLNGGQPLVTVASTIGAAATAKAVGDVGSSVDIQGIDLPGCILNVKATMKSLFKFISRFSRTDEACDFADSPHCVHIALKVMDALVGMGQFVSGAIGKCYPDYAPNANKIKVGTLCASMSIKLYHSLGKMDAAGQEMSVKCALTPTQRLYLEQNESAEVQRTGGSSVTLGLAALLPITAVLSFVVGSRIAKSRGQEVPQRDTESLINVE